MAESPVRRCAIWVDIATFAAAQELAGFAGVDIDTFVEFVVKQLHEQEVQALRGSEWVKRRS
jgi:hypothetical protein